MVALGEGDVSCERGTPVHKGSRCMYGATQIDRARARSSAPCKAGAEAGTRTMNAHRSALRQCSIIGALLQLGTTPKPNDTQSMINNKPLHPNPKPQTKIKTLTRNTTHRQVKYPTKGKALLCGTKFGQVNRIIMGERNLGSQPSWAHRTMIPPYRGTSLIRNRPPP